MNAIFSWKTIFRISWLMLGLLAVGSHGAELSTHATNSASVNGFLVADADALIHGIEVKHPEDIGRDGTGNVTSVVLRQGWASTSNLVLISAIASIRSIGLEPTQKVQPTQDGIAALGGLRNLENLRLACSWTLQEGVFRAVCNLRQVRHLSLSLACPSTDEYNYITNMQGLAELHVLYCTNFTDHQLTLITNLPNLRSIELRHDGLSSGAAAILSGMRTLTNVVIKPNPH